MSANPIEALIKLAEDHSVPVLFSAVVPPTPSPLEATLIGVIEAMARKERGGGQRSSSDMD